MMKMIALMDPHPENMEAQVEEVEMEIEVEMDMDTVDMVDIAVRAHIKNN